jgi:hypothetical protein
MSCDIRLDFEESNQELDLDFQEKIEVGGGGGISENRVVQIVKQETADLQPQVDEGLSTENKTVVGAINEVNETANKKTTVRVDGQKVDEFNADEKFDKTGGVIDGEVTIEGDLIVKGTTKTVDTETLSVKDNIIVANVDNAPLAGVSGFAVKTGEVDEETQKQLAYGIMYDKQGDGVKIGLGGFTENGDFVYNENQAQFLATRADTLADGHIPKWDNEKKQFVDSGAKIGEYVKSTDYAKGYFTTTRPENWGYGVVKPINGGQGGIDVPSTHAGGLRNLKATYDLIDARTPSNYLDGGTVGNDHCRPITPAVLDYATMSALADCKDTTLWTEERKATACETIGALKVQNPEFDEGATRGYVYFIDPNGNQITKKVQVQANVDTIPLRNPNGNFYISNPTLPYECTNKGYVEDNFVAKPTAITGYTRVPAIGASSLRQLFLNIHEGATPSAIPIRGAGGVLKAGTPIGDTDCVNLQYAEDNFVAKSSLSSSTLDEGTVPVRDAQGGFDVGEPLSEDSCTPRWYVEQHKGTKLYLHEITFAEASVGPEERSNKVKIISTKATPHTSLSMDDFIDGSMINFQIKMYTDSNEAWGTYRSIDTNIIYLHGLSSVATTTASINFTNINNSLVDTVTEL